MNDELIISDSTVSELERNIERVKNESRRLTGLMERSVVMMTEGLQSSSTSTAMDVKSLEQELWRLERECRLFSPSQNEPPSQSPPIQSLSPIHPPPTDIRNELLSTKEELAALKRQIQQITSPIPSPTFSSYSRQSTAEHHHHHYYYHLPEYSRELPPQHTPVPAETRDTITPVHPKIFRELPTPPLTASSSSSLSLHHERFNSALSAWPQIDIDQDRDPDDDDDILSDLRRKVSQESILTTISLLKITPKIKRSASHESIFESSISTSTPASSYYRSSSHRHQSPRSSPLSLSSTTSSPTYLSASAYLRQNNTSSLLLLSSARGKQSRGLSSRKSFWNLWENKSSSPSPRSSRRGLRNSSRSSELGRPVVICTEINVGMLQDALEG